MSYDPRSHVQQIQGEHTPESHGRLPEDRPSPKAVKQEPKPVSNPHPDTDEQYQEEPD